MSLDNAKSWFQMLLPAAEKAGPLLSLILALLLAGALWFGWGMLRECVDRNRLLGERLVSQQEKFHTEILLRLAHCPPPR